MNSEMPVRAGGRAVEPRQHEMDDVLGEIVLAVGDEDLGAEEAVAVAVAHRPGPQGADVRARLRLGQAHGAGPARRSISGWAVDLALRPRCRGAGWRRSHPGSAAGRAGSDRLAACPDLAGGGVDQPGQALAAIALRESEADPAALGEGAVGFAEAGGHPDGAVLEHGAGSRSPICVQRRQDAAPPSAPASASSGIDQVGRGVAPARAGPRPRPSARRHAAGRSRCRPAVPRSAVMAMRPRSARITPGLRMAVGSSASFSRRISSSSSGLLRAASSAALSRPMPCSALIEPPSSCTRSQTAWWMRSRSAPESGRRPAAGGC